MTVHHENAICRMPANQEWNGQLDKFELSDEHPQTLIKLSTLNLTLLAFEKVAGFNRFSKASTVFKFVIIIFEESPNPFRTFD